MSYLCDVVSLVVLSLDHMQLALHLTNTVCLQRQTAVSTDMRAHQIAAILYYIAPPSLLLWALQLSWDASVDADFLCDKASMLIVAVKDCALCLTVTCLLTVLKRWHWNNCNAGGKAFPLEHVPIVLVVHPALHQMWGASVLNMCVWLIVGQDVMFNSIPFL